MSPEPGDRLAFWNSRAALGETSGTQDLIARELEIRYLSRWLPKAGGRVLDAGCGNGYTLERLQGAGSGGFLGYGFDFSPAMVEQAQARLPLGVIFQGDLREIPSRLGAFGLVYTQRALINLETAADQRAAIRNLGECVAAGGHLVLMECSVYGLRNLNRLRQQVGLPEVVAPFHNRYLFDDEVTGVALHGMDFLQVDYPLDTYAFLSRVVQARLAMDEGHEPIYDHPINQMALMLDGPMVPHCGQGRAFVWRRM